MQYEDVLKSGTTLQEGKYTIISTLGQGGFGITYKARMKYEATGSIGTMMVESDVAIKEFFIKSECERDNSTYGDRGYTPPVMPGMVVVLISK